MTRRLPEGPWDPTKIPRFLILMSQDDFLVGVGSLIFPQVEGQTRRTRSVRKNQLDGTNGSHNPTISVSSLVFWQAVPATRITKLPRENAQDIGDYADYQVELDVYPPQSFNLRVT